MPETKGYVERPPDALEGSASPEELKFSHVVRAVAMRPRSVFDLAKILKNNPDFDLTNTNLTTIMWAEKDKKSVNPGEVMPVGGKIHTGESVGTAAAREVREETHTAPIGKITSLGRMSYVLKKKNTRISAEFVGVRQGAVDQSFPLEPEEDKISGFHYLNREQMEDLMMTDQVKVGASGRSVKMLGSLRVEPSGQEIIESEDDQTEVRENIAAFTEQMEAEKKIDVLKRLADIWRQDGADGVRVAEKIESYFNGVDATDWNAVKIAWQYSLRISREAADKGEVATAKTKTNRWDKVLMAVDLSNFADEINFAPNEGGFQSGIEAFLRFIYVLLETKFYHDDYLKIAEGNAFLAPYISRLKKFINKMVPGDGGMTEKLSTLASFVGQIQSDLAVSGAETSPERAGLEKKFCKEFVLDKKNLDDRLLEIDRSLRWVEENALAPRLKGGEHHREVIKQLNKVTNANLTQLLYLALPPGPKDGREAVSTGWKKDFSNPESQRKYWKRLVFEARRKLAMLVTLSSGANFYIEQARAQVGNVIEANIFGSSFFPPDNYDYDLAQKTDADGKAIDLIPVRSEIPPGVDPDEFAASAPGTAFKKVHTAEGNYFIENDRPTSLKELESFLNKIIIRGADDPTRIKDIARRALVVAEPEVFSSDWNDRVTVDLPPNVKTRTAGSSATDHKPVLNIIASIASIPGVTIENYLPTPESGAKIKSSAAGGGGEVRYAKFYIRYDSPDTQNVPRKKGSRVKKKSVYYEEVQIFVPDSYGRSGFYYKELKEADDQRYFLARLFKTRGRNSHIDLLYPPKIYGTPVLEASRGFADKDGQI